MISNAIGRAGKFILGLIVSVSITPADKSQHPDLYRSGDQLFGRHGIRLRHDAARRAYVMLAGLFDMLDGEVARTRRAETRFGAFYDSVIDRYSDIIILQGLMVWYARQQNARLCGSRRG